MQLNIVFLLRVAIDGQDNLALFCEFHCVADEIHQDLPQASWIANDNFGHLSVDVADQFQPFLAGPETDRPDYLAQVLAQIEINFFEFQLAGFYLGKIKNIVDDHQQRLCGCLHHVEVFALLPA